MVLEIDAVMINCERGAASPLEVPISFSLSANATACQSLELFTQVILAGILAGAN
jgi:hypothetical protein